MLPVPAPQDSVNPSRVLVDEAGRGIFTGDTLLPQACDIDIVANLLRVVQMPLLMEYGIVNAQGCSNVETFLNSRIVSASDPRRWLLPLEQSFPRPVAHLVRFRLGLDSYPVALSFAAFLTWSC